jgi:hypothetical protein
MNKFYVIDAGTGETVDEANSLDKAIVRAKTYLREEDLDELVITEARRLVKMNLTVEEIS